LILARKSSERLWTARLAAALLEPNVHYQWVEAGIFCRTREDGSQAHPVGEPDARECYCLRRHPRPHYQGVYSFVMQ